jgi:uncharacterized membrane protein
MNEELNESINHHQSINQSIENCNLTHYLKVKVHQPGSNSGSNSQRVFLVLFFRCVRFIIDDTIHCCQQQQQQQQQQKQRSIISVIIPLKFGSKRIYRLLLLLTACLIFIYLTWVLREKMKNSLTC